MYNCLALSPDWYWLPCCSVLAGMFHLNIGVAERIWNMGFNELNPNANEPVKVSEILEERHRTQAFHHIDKGLSEYLCDYSHEYTSELCSDGYLWIMLGEFPVSKNLKGSIRQRYAVDSEKELQFKRWNSLKDYFPNAGYPKVKGSNPVFVGFPLPEEEL